ncbi:hypothetical protein cypCar_00037927, partial [Cyprinus carpio]
EALRETLSSDELHQRDQWTLFGNEAEKLEIGVIRNQRVVRERVDRLALRWEAERKASLHMKFIEDLSMKAPDFPVPLRPHAVWAGMDVKLSCLIQGCPVPSITWYKDDVPLRGSLPWNYKLTQKCGLDVLEIRRCSAEDAGEYKVIARSSLGEATSSARLIVNSHEGAEAKLKRSWTPISVPEPDAQLASTFPPTFVKEGDNLVLQCSFTTALLPFQQDVTWYRDDGPAVVVGAPGSPLQVKCSDVSRDYVFLSWIPPSADGAAAVQGYFIERCDIGVGKWERCNDVIQRECHYPIMGLKENTMYQFRVCAVNQAGVGRPSKSTEPILTSDPLEPSRTTVVKVERGREIVITKDQLEVDGLKTNKEYVFRVKSVGLAGNSIYSEESPAIQVKSAICVPSRPSAIALLHCTGAEMLIGWRAPANHGGDPVRGYYLDQREKSQSSWREISVKPTKERVYEVTGLQEGSFYQFRVFAANIVGLGEASEASELFLCERWTMPEPGCPYDLEFREVRRNSLVLLWAEPLYKGQSEISGYVVEISEGAESEDWTPVTSEPVTETHLKVPLTSLLIAKFRI